MQKKRRISIIFILCLVVLAGVVSLILVNRALANQQNQQLYRAVRNHVREYGESEATLGELMGFDWEQALFFDYNTTAKAIYETIGVVFSPIDTVTRGLLFIKDGEIVYYEYFPERGIGIDIYPVRIAMGGHARNLDIFEGDSVFLLSVGEDYFGNRIYWLHPRI